MVSQAIDDIGSSVWKSTAEIVTHGADKLFVAVATGFDFDFDSNNEFVFGLGFSEDGLLVF